MIVTRTPFRISFFGGGTDYPAWYRKEGGAVLSTTINKYCYLTVRYLPVFFPTVHRVVWSHIEAVSTIGEILHPAVREGLRMLSFDNSRGVEIHHQGDLPARSGMGSSSAFAVGLIHGLRLLRGEQVSAAHLYREAITLEQERLHENVGSQDQVATACGGFNHIRFHPDDSIEVEPVGLPPERSAELNSRLMLYFTGTSRLSSEIAGDVVQNIPSRDRHLRRLAGMVDQGLDILRHGDLEDFGQLLDEAWQVKKELSSGVSSPAVDEIYERARAAGAIGGKLLGAGGSGFMVFYVPPGHQESVRAALSNLLHVPFEFETDGSVAMDDAVRIPPAE